MVYLVQMKSQGKVKVCGRTYRPTRTVPDHLIWEKILYIYNPNISLQWYQVIYRLLYCSSHVIHWLHKIMQKINKQYLITSNLPRSSNYTVCSMTLTSLGINNISTCNKATRRLIKQEARHSTGFSKFTKSNIPNCTKSCTFHYLQRHCEADMLRCQYDNVPAGWTDSCTGITKSQ